jgi:HlyD family secretion protein
MKKLHEGGYVARDEYDQADAEAKRTGALRLSADAAVVAAKADLERAEAVLRHSAAQGPGNTGETVMVRSPVSGRVLKRHRESAGVVNSGDALLDIGDPRNLEVYAEVLSADAVKIRKGTPVLFERWGGETALEGKVRVVEPAGFTKVSSLGVEEQRVNVIVDFTSPPDVWQGLGDGYRLDASFIIWESKDVLRVPASALFRKGEGWAVFAVENKHARLREVETGKRNGLQAEILSGINAGEVVIVHPDDAVRDGVKVKVR